MDSITKKAALEGLGNALASIRLLLEDPEIQEIEINGPNNVWVERAGTQSKTDILIDEAKIRNAIAVLARLSNKDAKGGTPNGIIDARLDGFRVAAVLPPTSVQGPSICIRKHNPVVLTLDDYVQSGAMPQSVAEALAGMVLDRKNVLIAGSTSSGKTTLVNAMIALIPEEERVLTIEDTVELKVRVPNWVSLESNEQGGVTTRMLIRLALRYRPDRIIVGEVRGGEAYDLLQAANTGHDGCIATLHANSAVDALSRLETMVLQADVNWPHAAICSQIARTFDYVIFMTRKRGKRQLAEVIKLEDYETSAGKYIFSKLHNSEVIT